MTSGIHENVSLLPFNTFGIAASARYFAEANNLNELQSALRWSQEQQMDRLILGGGSNVLFTRDFDGIAIRINLEGIAVVDEDESSYLVEAGAGESWHGFVMHCIEQGYAGVENLSLIPGSVGAAPMQNIGAYGVELKHVFHELKALHIESGELHTFSAADCAFGYRTSVFKTSLKGQYVLTSVTFRLQKTPQFNTSYGAIEKELETMQVDELSIRAISQAVINIRSSKLPDPKQIGNAGSFFKNPVIPTAQFEELKVKYPEIVGYPAGDQTKVAAGWLIERAGWKGKRIANHGVHERQALVLVNYGGAEGQAIYDLSTDIRAAVLDQFGIALEREVNIV